MNVCMYIKHHKALDCQVRLTQSKVLPSIQTPQITTRIITRDSDKGTAGEASLGPSLLE